MRKTMGEWVSTGYYLPGGGEIVVDRLFGLK